jgi:2-aminoadipate transaminase
MLDAIAHEWPAEMTPLRPEGGFFLWCKLPYGMSAEALRLRAETHGATFLSGTRCFADGQGDDFIRLAFSYQPAERIIEGIARIGAAMREV